MFPRNLLGDVVALSFAPPRQLLIIHGGQDRLLKDLSVLVRNRHISSVANPGRLCRHFLSSCRGERPTSSPPPYCTIVLVHITLPALNEGGTAGLDGLNLSHVEGGAVEAGGQLGGVEVDARGRSDGTQVGTGGAANAGARADGLLEGTVLLCVVAVGAEGAVAGGGGRGADEALGELAGGRGGVRLGGVVDRGCKVSAGAN